MSNFIIDNDKRNQKKTYHRWVSLFILTLNLNSVYDSWHKSMSRGHPMNSYHLFVQLSTIFLPCFLFYGPISLLFFYFTFLFCRISFFKAHFHSFAVVIHIGIHTCKRTYQISDILCVLCSSKSNGRFSRFDRKLCPIFRQLNLIHYALSFVIWYSCFGSVFKTQLRKLLSFIISSLKAFPSFIHSHWAWFKVCQCWYCSINLPRMLNNSPAIAKQSS